MGVPIHWTGPLDWTGLLDRPFDLILGVASKLIMELSGFLFSEASKTATDYNNAHMEHCNCANFQVANSKKAFSHQAACVVSAH